MPSIEETVEKIDAVTVGRVRDYAEKMAGGTGTAMTLYGPASAAPGLDALRARLAA